MRRILFVLCLSVLFSGFAYAVEIDLLTGDFVATSTDDDSDKKPAKTKDSEIKKEIEENIEAKKDDDEENQQGNSGGIFGFMRPLTSLFNNENELGSDGKKETFLEKSIRLAEEGNLSAQLDLAYMYLYGINNIEQNSAEAVKYYTMAAEQNDPTAINNLASLYFSGIGTEKDVKKAFELFQKASDLGNDNASLNLAFLYLAGGKKDDVRNQKAVELFEKSAKDGNKIAQFMSGYAYCKGFVVACNYAQCYKLMNSAATGEAQIDEAQLMLAELYLKGLGTVQNYAKGIEAYEKAVAQGNLDADIYLADLLIEGKYVQKNPAKAYMLYNIAAARGRQDALEKRNILAASIPLQSINEVQNLAQMFKEEPSELTSYIRQTYGTNLRNYIDVNIKRKKDD